MASDNSFWSCNDCNESNTAKRVRNSDNADDDNDDNEFGSANAIVGGWDCSYCTHDLGSLAEKAGAAAAAGTTAAAAVTTTTLAQLGVLFVEFFKYYGGLMLCVCVFRNWVDY